YAVREYVLPSSRALRSWQPAPAGCRTAPVSGRPLGPGHESGRDDRYPRLSLLAGVQMSSQAEAFYAERDQRTIQVGGHNAALSRPVYLVVGPDAAASQPGQAAVLATVNMLARVHRQLHLVIPAAPALA